MNAPVPPIWTTGSTEVFRTGTWRAALPRHIAATSPCRAACPVNGEIADWIGRARAGDFRSAWEVLTRHNPFPAIAGRICHHPCEAACNRAGFDEALAICGLERFVGDQALRQGWAFARPATEREARIAVIGGGPSGLSAAYQLRRRGYQVTLFEAQSALGGLMRYGIPPYRLPRAVLDAEIGRIVALGIEVRCGEPLSAPQDLQRVRTAFDAVYLATGAQRRKRLPPLEGVDAAVIDGAEYLARSARGARPPLGRRVVVLGGGSAAFDVARSARRAGHDVTVVALESVAQLPAQRDEVEQALEEGIVLVTGGMLTRARVLDGPLQDAAGTSLRLDFVRVRFTAGAQRGEFTVTPLPDSDFALVADAVLPAIGQDPDLDPLRGLDADGPLLKVDANLATSAQRVWAGGDLASTARFVTEAVGMGKRAAAQIDRWLRGVAAATGERAAVPGEHEAVVPLAAIATAYYAPQPRVAQSRVAAAERVKGDLEVQLGLDLEAALAESQRCFSCGTCIRCDTCVAVCPDLAVRREGDGYAVLGDYCKGCGLCVRECPTGSMKMVEEAR